MAELSPSAEVEVYRSYPSWWYFTWLYLFSLMAGLRGLLLLQVGVEGAEIWELVAVTFVAIAAIMRKWAETIVTSKRVLLRSGYTGREIQSLSLDKIGDMTVKQGPVDRFLDIGTIVLHSSRDDRSLLLRGVPHPGVLTTRLKAIRPEIERKPPESEWNA
jgi:hypothetical protein